MTNEKTAVPLHTPAPWLLNDCDDAHDCAVTIRTESDTLIAVMADETGEDWSESEILANAHLIAAAPELLEALESIIPDLEQLNGLYSEDDNPDSYENLRAVRAVIAKAKGE